MGAPNSLLDLLVRDRIGPHGNGQRRRPWMARALVDDYIRAIYAIVDGVNVRDSRVHNYPPRWNAAPSQELLVIRRNHQTGEVSLDPLRWGLIPYWCNDPNGGRNNSMVG